MTAIDPDDEVFSVTLSYWPGNSGVLTVAMTKIGTSDNWQATITAQDSWWAGEQDGLINYWVQAVDSNGNQSGVLDFSNAYTLYKEICLT